MGLLLGAVTAVALVLGGFASRHADRVAERACQRSEAVCTCRPLFAPQRWNEDTWHWALEYVAPTPVVSVSLGKYTSTYSAMVCIATDRVTGEAMLEQAQRIFDGKRRPTEVE